MNRTIDYYCDMEFWKSFMDSCNIKFSVIASDEEWLGNESKRFLFRRLVDEISLHLDCTEEELQEEIDRESKSYDESMRLLEMKLIDRDGGNASVLDCSYDYKNNQFSSVDDNSTYFTNNPATRKAIEKKGVMVVSQQDISSGRFNIRKPKEIIKGQNYEWGKVLNKARHFCNSLIICDSYISKNTNDNLFPILDVLIPQKLERPFQLTIITAEGHSFSFGEQVKLLYDSIQDYLRKSCKDKSVDLTIVRADTGQQHDRKILSNNVYIECAGGFDLMKRGKATKQTTVGISFPKFSNPRDLDTYYNVLSQAKSIIQADKIVSENDKYSEDRLACNRILCQI